MIGFSVLTIVAADLLGRAASFVDQTFFDPPSPEKTLAAQDTRRKVAAYDGADYDVERLFREFAATHRIVYSPYTIWRRKFFKGELVNIDITGVRVTHGNSDRDDALQVWMFGGSTLWGEGAPDAQTIPSNLAELLNKSLNVHARVKNYGERGFVSTQEVVYLLRQLQTKPPPDVVVFYDGVNDAATASNWPEVPGVHVSLDRIRTRFEGGFVDEEQRRGFVRSLGLYRAARIVLDRIDARSYSDVRLSTDPPTADELSPRYLDEADFDFLGDLALRIWMKNHSYVEALGDKFGFIPIFVLHPSMWTEGKPLHDSELAILAEEFRSRGMTHIMATRAKLAELLDDRLEGSRDLDGIYNLADAFQGISDPLYIDYVHVTGRGNAIVAEKLLDIVKGELCGRPPRRASDHTRAQLAAACS